MLIYMYIYMVEILFFSWSIAILLFSNSEQYSKILFICKIQIFFNSNGAKWKNLTEKKKISIVDEQAVFLQTEVYYVYRGGGGTPLWLSVSRFKSPLPPPRQLKIITRSSWKSWQNIIRLDWMEVNVLKSIYSLRPMTHTPLML